MSNSVAYNGVSLSQSRLDRIENANSLGEAQRMGIFDRITDLFRGGVKKEAIKQAFEALHPPEPSAPDALARHEGLLVHFGNLRSALRPDAASQCQLQVSANHEAGTWSYTMSVDGDHVVSGSDLPIAKGFTLAAFQDYAMLSNLGDHLVETAGADPADAIKSLHQQFSEMNAVHMQAEGTLPASVAMEKFAVITQRLDALGAPPSSFPAIDIEPDLSSAKFMVGVHEVGTCPITDQAGLTDALVTKALVGTVMVDRFLAARDDQQEIRNTVQDMVDGGDEQSALREKLQDSHFSRANFVDAQPLQSDSSKFSATFRDSQSGREETLILSNRSATNGELRADRLREKFATADYGTLSDLIAEDLGTEKDPQIVYFMNGVRNELMGALRTLTAADDESAEIRERMSLETPEAASSYTQMLQESYIAPLDVGKTTLGQLWGWSTAAPPPSPVQAPSIGDFLAMRA